MLFYIDKPVLLAIGLCLLYVIINKTFMEHNMKRFL
jgi:hypothetical protein